MKYRVGLDIGIGSVGWAVISGEREEAKIEDFGVRIFESGENEKKKERTSQQRRKYRGARRLIRRRAFRKALLKNHFENIGLLNESFCDELSACKDKDVYELKVKGLDEKLTPAELYKCLVHTCNHRGYRSFYENDDYGEDIVDVEEDKEAGKNTEAVHSFGQMYAKSGKRSVSEYLLSDYKNGNFVVFRNGDRRKEQGEYLLIGRDLLKDEAQKILKTQSKFYPCLNDENVSRTVEIIFAQRNFEDGPGDKNDAFRRYAGFLAKIGKCRFYKDEDRGVRSTVISDVYAVVNVLSQCRYVDDSTGEVYLKKEIAQKLIDSLLKNAGLTKTEIEGILEEEGFSFVTASNFDGKAWKNAVKYLKTAKKFTEEAGLDWYEMIKEDQFDIEKPSKLHLIGETLAKYITPQLRKKELQKLGFVNDGLMKACLGVKAGGTSSVSYKYMCDATSAFKNGEIYGVFQGRVNAGISEEQNAERKKKLSVEDFFDEDVKDNPVVYKAINETRKVLNAIIEIYGFPYAVAVEVADELSNSFETRDRIKNKQDEKQKEKERIRKRIIEMGIEEKDISAQMIDKVILYDLQGGKCAYSDKVLNEHNGLKAVLMDKDKVYEVDHIVPFSLILDNTLNNKVLVFTGENQGKGQKVPLMWLEGEKRKKFIENVKRQKNEGKISRKKYEYLMLKTIDSPEAEELLSAWKSRNINDTRYITKYVVGAIKTKLKFSDDAPHVIGVKGALTSKFRKIWLRTNQWGEDDKDRKTYLNHAVDAVVVANMTPPYIEIASNALELNRIYKRNGRKVTSEYNDYIAKCCERMKKFYGFPVDYTDKLLKDVGKIPAYLPRIADEVKVRFNEDEKTFAESVKNFYGNGVQFVVEPHIPLTSHKLTRKFSGQIADDNPIKIIEIDGEKYKISRKKIADLKKDDIQNVYTQDTTLVDSLETIFKGKDGNYKVGKYLKENGLKEFKIGDRPVYKVSVKTKAAGFYRTEKGENNYTNHAVPKYYCLEIYKNTDGKTSLFGIRYFDIVKKDKKLFLKKEALPADYKEHLTYLFPNDYFAVEEKGEVKYEGFYCSIKNINQNLIYYKEHNESNMGVKGISSKCSVKVYDVSILGKKGGVVKCSEALPLITGKE